MSDLKEELINCVRHIPDERLIAIKPLLFMLYNDTPMLEAVLYEDLTAEEKESVDRGRGEYANGETVDFEAYMLERGITQ
jgi:hypothetical protein